MKIEKPKWAVLANINVDVQTAAENAFVISKISAGNSFLK
jgi:hypothetical protein